MSFQLENTLALKAWKSMPSRKVLWPALAFTSYLVFALYIQFSAGAWDAAFSSYPDEPAHFTGAVMVRDAFTSNLSSDPIRFAQNYYTHYPYFAVGYWPPLFYIVMGFWFLLVGVGRLQALIIIAGVTAGTSVLVFGLVRKRGGLLVGFFAGFVVLSLPEVQRLTCAVMLDEMVAFFCLCAAVLLLRFLEQPTMRNAVYYGLCCSCAVLTKYNSAYVCVLPLAAAICLRRSPLLRTPGFYAQFIVVVLAVGPWLSWTARLALRGIPDERSGTLFERAGFFCTASFRMFPPHVASAVVFGLLAMAVSSKICRADIVVMCLLYFGVITLLIISPVGPEQRYLLVAAIALLVLSLSGWVDVFELLNGKSQIVAPSGGVFAALLMLFLVALTTGRFKLPENSVRPIVRFITQNGNWSNSRILVDQDLEGPIIAEFAMQDRHRPGYTLLRPDKLLADEDWFGRKYTCKFRSLEDVVAHFQRDPVQLIIWCDKPGTQLREHQRFIKEMVTRYPRIWHRLSSFESGSAHPLTWTIYEHVTR
jgi:hypothetical protein